MRGDPRNPSETEFRKTVIEAAKVLGWKVWSIQDDVYKTVFVAARELGITPKLPGAGWPDLVLVRGDRLVFVELKSNTGTVRSEQDDWLAALEETCADVFVIRPRDWDWFAPVLE
jgi:hypothetical protein